MLLQEHEEDLSDPVSGVVNEVLGQFRKKS